MIDFHDWSTRDGWKASIIFEATLFGRIAQSVLAAGQ